MARGWGRERKVRAGSGSPLPPYRWWQMFGRTLRSIAVAGPDGRTSIYTVDVRHAGDLTDGVVRARLYVDGRLRSSSTLPARFPLSGGHIDVAITGFGMKRCHYVPAGGTPRPLTPDPASAEGRRARLQQRHPASSRALGLLSAALVMAGLGVEIPQIIEALSRMPPVAETIGTFTSPYHLPLAVNLAIGLGAVLGSTERALRMRSGWLDELAS